MIKKNYKTLAKLIELLHLIITISMLCAMFFIFFYKPLQIYSAIWLASIWLIKQGYGKCPLTLAEYKLRTLSGEKVKRKGFIQRLFKKCFNLNIPIWLSNTVLTIFFFISIIILIQHFFF